MPFWLATVQTEPVALNRLSRLFQAELEVRGDGRNFTWLFILLESLVI